jgi:hypothetical protein
MDIYHDTSLRFILEEDSISLASKAHIHFCSSKGLGLWLVTKPSIYCTLHTLFSPQRSIFILVQFSPQRLVFSNVSVDMGWKHLARTYFITHLEVSE